MRGSAFLETSKTFIRRKGSVLALPMGSNWYLLILINFCLDNEKWGFKNTKMRRFFPAKNLYPPKESSLALPIGSIWFLSILINFFLGNEKWGFKNINKETTIIFRQKPLLCGRTDGRRFFVASYFFIWDMLSGQSLSGPAPFLQLLTGLFSFGGFVGVSQGTRCRPAFAGVCLGFTHKSLLVLPFKLVSLKSYRCFHVKSPPPRRLFSG